MTQQLDVRRQPPVRRHQLIFEAYGALGAGESFELVNDLDPMPRYYPFAAEHAEHAGGFPWYPLEKGPEVWRARIGRTRA